MMALSFATSSLSWFLLALLVISFTRAAYASEVTVSSCHVAHMLGTRVRHLNSHWGAWTCTVPDTNAAYRVVVCGRDVDEHERLGVAAQRVLHQLHHQNTTPHQEGRKRSDSVHCGLGSFQSTTSESCISCRPCRHNTMQILQGEARVNNMTVSRIQTQRLKMSDLEYRWRLLKLSLSPG